jgi:hypothetical protein
MGEKERGGDSISAHIEGTITGQVAVGKDITQEQRAGAAGPTEEELAALREELAGLRLLVEAQAPPERKQAALERVDELAQAVMAEKPDLTTMEYVTRWFGKHLPAMAGAVTSVVVNPIVGRLVAAAGDALAGEFGRRFGSGKAPG